MTDRQFKRKITGNLYENTPTSPGAGEVSTKRHLRNRKTQNGSLRKKMSRTLEGVVFIVAFIFMSARVDLTTLECDETDIECDGACINTTLQCNNEYDCIDGSDESFETCGCRDDQFACPDRCIPLVERCDRNCTCGDCSDEEGCESFVCLPYYDQCKNHFCIPRFKICNFIDDCGDNSDEEDCHHVECDGLFHFECDNLQCVPLAYVCDGIEDCSDGSDELPCERENFHICEDGNKVHESELCDMKADCKSGSDEHGCECDPVQCPAEKRCFPYEIRCNNFCECIDCSDEENCGSPCDVNNGVYCPFFDHFMGSFRPSGCVRSERICDQRQDCGRYEDENVCDSTFTNFELIPCTNDKDKRLIPSFALCDGHPYCMMGTDEQNCGTEDSTCGPGKFQCTHLQVMCVNETMRCDGFWNCQDYSDEENCEDYECPDETQFKCRGTGQCLASHQHCNGEVECVYLNGTKDGSDEEDCDDAFRECNVDEFRCHSNHCIEGWRRCYKAPDDYLFGCKDGSHLWDCANWTCNGDDQFKCPRDYCILSSTRCNGYPDCENHADEICASFCHPEKYPGCVCDGKYFNCSEMGLTTVDLNYFTDDMVTWINLSHNHLNVSQLKTGLRSDVSLRLIHLELSHNNLQDLPAGLFEMMMSLRFLDVGYNSINKIEKEAFRGLYNLKTLILRGNVIQFIEDGSFYGLNQLTHLDLSYQRLVYLDASPFVGLYRIHTLDISNNPLQTVPPSAFFGLTNIKTIDLSNNQVKFIQENTFKGLPHLKKIITDEFRFCCAVNYMAEDIECLPQGDEFSSCEDLMRNKFLRLNLWIVGLVATLCNAVVIVTRSGKRRDSRVQSFLITNLAIGDMCMGIYLLIIAVADFHFRGRYGVYDYWWKHSVLCKLAGFLSTFSSELSVLSLTFITLHRVSSIVFPFRTKDMGFSRIVWIMTAAWCLVFALAVIPILGIPYFGNFYGRSGVCLALHITPDKPSGWEYSVFVFLVLNFFSFMFIAGAYIVMFYVARRTQQAAKRSLRSNKGSDAMARKMTLIVFTDFCCWMPIIVLGVASLCGARIHPQVFAWIAVFVLPLNSAVNPLLYTLWTAPYARQIINRARETILRSTATTEYKLSANLSTSEKFSSAMNGRRRGNRALPGTSSVRLPPEKSTGSVRSSDVIHDPEETIRMNEMSHNKGNVYVNPNNNQDGKIADRGNYEKLLNDKGMEVQGGHSSGEE